MDQHQYDFRLDNAGKLYPATLSRARTTIFRVAAVLDHPVNIERLQKAAEHMMKRCPYYQVSLKSGLFWYYFEKTDILPLIHAESRYPCLYIPYKKKGALPFRIIAYQKRIAVEMSHILADGRATLTFLNGLIREYLRLGGEEIDTQGLVFDCSDPPDSDEFSDSYKRYFETIVPKAPSASNAAQVKGGHLSPPTYRISEGEVSAAILKEKAGELRVSIGEYLTALLLKVLCEQERKKRRMKPVVVTIPIDVRAFMPSKTMRNFMLTTEPSIDPRLGEFSFNEIIKKVHHYMRYEVDDRMVKTQIARNIRGESNVFVRIIPLILKNPILRWINRHMGETTYTMSFSNLGRVKIPEAMAEKVTKYEFIPPRTFRAVNATAVGYKDSVYICFGSTLKEKQVEACFFAEMRRLDIPVKIVSNSFNKRRVK